ncbi:MAG: ATP-binding cassette domain-containing protein, partial [Actinomycetota bacterium]|nr:ATP-binding cassette domain-containing protein [Actinomycetota bacterium]
VELAGLLALGGAVALAVGAGAAEATALVVGVLAFVAVAALQDLVFVARRVVPIRNALARVLEPLAAPQADPAPRPTVAGCQRGAAISLRGLRVTAGASVLLHAINLELAPGEHVAVVGASGAGKSSLVAALAGWLVPDAGELLLDGGPLAGAELAQLRAATAWADATTRLFDASLEENASFGAAADAAPSRERLETVGLGHAVAWHGDLSVGRDGSRLSNTERQRLKVARALGRPGARLVLLDEALGGLETSELRELVTLLRVVWHDATLVHVTHDVRSVLDFHRVLVVEDGRIVQDGHPRRLSAEPDGRFAVLLRDQGRLAERLADSPVRRDGVNAPEAEDRSRRTGLGELVLCRGVIAVRRGAPGGRGGDRRVDRRR